MLDLHGFQWIAEAVGEQANVFPRQFAAVRLDPIMVGQTETEVPHEQALRGGDALLLQKRGNAGTNWQLTLVGTERGNYMEIVGRSDVITMRLERRVLDVLSRARLQKWVNDLETAYADYAELTGWTPYRHVYINMLAPETAWGYACEGGIIQIDADCIYEDLSLNFARRKNDWNFGLLHELSHLFEADSRPWDFHAEVLADYKLAYVMTKNNCAAVPARSNSSYADKNGSFFLLIMYSLYAANTPGMSTPNGQSMQ